MNLDVYELKPFAKKVKMAENFSTNNGGRGGGGGYMLQHHHQRAMAVATTAVEMVGQVGFNCQEIKPINFVILDEVSCIIGEKLLYKKISMNSAKKRVSPAPQKTHKVERNPMWLRGSGQLKKTGGKFKIIIIIIIIK